MEVWTLYIVEYVPSSLYGSRTWQELGRYKTASEARKHADALQGLYVYRIRNGNNDIDPAYSEALYGSGKKNKCSGYVSREDARKAMGL
jgi:hypothetical protein|nr:MAG TPA_asm: hypothetical protein [Caudoviricetes sp.]